MWARLAKGFRHHMVFRYSPPFAAVSAESASGGSRRHAGGLSLMLLVLSRTLRAHPPARPPHALRRRLTAEVALHGRRGRERELRQGRPSVSRGGISAFSNNSSNRGAHRS